jgi:hypothetical protein
MVRFNRAVSRSSPCSWAVFRAGRRRHAAYEDLDRRFDAVSALWRPATLPEAPRRRAAPWERAITVMRRGLPPDWPDPACLPYRRFDGKAPVARCDAPGTWGERPRGNRSDGVLPWGLGA